LGDCNDNDPTNASIIYVNAGAVGTHDGTSWAKAFLTLQDALANTTTCTKQIWVAAGTYYPDEGGGKTNNDKNAFFSMKNGIAIYGGFLGTEISLSQRNWVQNKTILSGDINKDGITDTSNSLSVISNSSVNNTALLDGFTVTAGYATSFGPAFGGGGMSMGSSSPVIVNCIFSGNKANYGGAIYTASSSPLFKDCSFIGNSALYSQAPLYGGNGGAFYDNRFSSPPGTPTFINCTFSKNTAEHQADVIWDSVHAVITNCIMWGNGQNGGDFLIPLTVTYSVLQGYAGGTGNLNNVDPLFADAAANDFRLYLGSPAVDIGLDSVNNEILDLGFIPRKAGVIDPGAYEYAKTCNAYGWVKDADGDNYFAGGTIYQCTSPGIGYKVIGNQQPGDCNDNDSTINPATIWYLDADSDGYKDPNYIASPSCTPPQDGKHYTAVSKGSDCNDNDAARTPETIWIKDADGDGYYTGNIILGCIIQSGYKVRTNEMPGDCNDNAASAHPGATEIFNGIDDNCNGQIDEGLCSVATNLRVTNITTNSATINWNAATNGTKYNLSYKAANVSTWTAVKSIKGTSYNLTGLSLYTAYNYKVQTVCPYAEKSAYSPVATFNTTYGGPTYCATKGNTYYEYINKVVLGSAISNTSGDNGGYGDFNGMNATVTAGGTYQIKLTPGFHFNIYNEYWEVYIDYNQDGVFALSEKVVAGARQRHFQKTSLFRSLLRMALQECVL
jgi:hypothetical protein